MDNSDDLNDARQFLKALGWLVLGCALWLVLVWLVLTVCEFFWGTT